LTEAQTDLLERNLGQAQFNASDLRARLAVDNEFFIQFAIPEQLELDVPNFHVELVDLNTDPKAQQQAIAMPRGHAKTTMVKVAISKKIFHTKRKFFVYLTDTGPVAKGAVRDIVNIIKQDNFKAVYGEQEWLKENETEGLFIVKLTCWANLNKPYTKTVIIRALGAGQQVRGLNIDNNRPDDLTCDDVEDDEIVNTEEQRKKFIKWLYGTVFKACARDHTKIYIGNLISNDCVLKKLLEDQNWFAVRYGAIKSDGTPLWPEKFPIVELAKEFQEFKRMGLLSRWFAEMMNMPMPEGLAIIRIDEIEFRPARVPGDLELGFIVIDPAISQKTHANNTAITVHGFVENRWQIVETSCGKLDPIQTFWEMVRLCTYWKISLVGIENTAFQASLQFFYPLLLGQYRQLGIQIVPLEASGRKTERILAWASWLKDKTYVLSENDTAQTTQLLLYDTSKKENEDDNIDSASYGLQMISKYLGMMSLSLDTSGRGYQDSTVVCAI